MKGLHGIANQVAEENAQRICRKVIRQFQKMPAVMSGEDSGLDNVWDEICVQQQIEESYNWRSYEEMIEALVECEVEDLKSHEQSALWFQTTEFMEWETDQDEVDGSDYPPVCNTDIVLYLIGDYIFREANNWSNQRIKNFNNSRCG
jgi:hypothetical protein